MSLSVYSAATSFRILHHCLLETAAIINPKMKYQQALSASAAAAPTSNEIFEFGLSFKKGDESIKGLTFSGSPPRIESIAPGTKIRLPTMTPRQGPSSVLGFYFVALQVANMEIFGVEDAVVLEDLLQEYTADREFCLMLSSHPPPDVTGRRVKSWLDDVNQKGGDGDASVIQCLYKYDLPPKDLGVKVTGSPPQLTDLTPDSPLNQCISHLKYKTLLVKSILFPDQERPDVTEASVGFNASLIVEVLEATNNIEERQLVLKEVIDAEDAAMRRKKGKPVVVDENTSANTMPSSSSWEGLCCW